MGQRLSNFFNLRPKRSQNFEILEKFDLERIFIGQCALFLKGFNQVVTLRINVCKIFKFKLNLFSKVLFKNILIDYSFDARGPMKKLST